MNNQNKLINDILLTYSAILENKRIVEASDVYDNVDFENIGHGNPASDNINTTLLQDIETAAKAAGVKVDITTAVSGHKEKTKSGNTSRHPSGNAVDIAKINNRAVSLSNRADADKLVAALVSMGYTKNAEGPSNPKSVLTFGFEGHDNHVHVSNTTSSPSTITKTTTSDATTGTTSDATTGTTSGSAGNFAKRMGQALLGSIGINESLDYKSLGNKVSLKSGNIILPKENNSKIKSPVSGVFSNHFNNCDGLTIKFEDGDKIFYINYCGIVSSDFRIGQKIKKGDVIGYPESDVNVTIFNSKGRKEYTNTKSNSNSNKGLSSLFKKKDKSSSPNNNNSKDYSQYSKLGKEFIKIKDNLFKVDKKDKLEENIKRIKGLL